MMPARRGSAIAGPLRESPLPPDCLEVEVEWIESQWLGFCTDGC